MAQYERRLFRFRFSIRELMHIGTSATLAATAATTLTAESALAAENYADWGHATEFILDTSPAGADVPGTVADFPVLVRLTAANFPFAQARGKGQDLRFSNPDNSPLAYQIERWDSARALAEVWVKIGSVAGNTAGQAFRMHWGKASAADSSDGPAVFSNKQVAVWHLGGATGSRANSVAGGNPAAPMNYNGDRSRDGIIGRADELDGQDDYLDMGDGYQDFSGGLSFTVWAYPTAVAKYARFFELGNGESNANIMLTRDSTTNNLRFDNYNPGSTVGTLRSGAALSLNQWQMFAVNVSGQAVKIYKNGAVVAQGNLPNTMANTWRASNFLGKSNWAWDATFQGLLDEPVLSKTTHSDNWYKLGYQNQKAAQNLVTVKPATVCARAFKGAADMTINEGGTAVLAAAADCAAGFMWSVVSGPAPRILDPEVKSLSVSMPRVAGDTVIVYRFTAMYGDSTPYRDVRVTVKEAIPEPAFTLPAGLVWDGEGPMDFRPAISNLAALRASRDTALHWSWSLAGPETDTAWLKDGLTLKRTALGGKLTIGLCLDNSGPQVCKTSAVSISRGAGGTNAIRASVEAARAQGAKPRIRDFRDATGRLRSGSPSNLFGAQARTQAP